MSLYDLQQRTDLILKKYAKYDTTMDKEAHAKSDDPFGEEYAELDAQVAALNAQAAQAAAEQNRALAAAQNAEIRKAKQQMLAEGIGALQRKLRRGKGVTKAIVEEREARVKALIERIYAVPDGVGGNRRPLKIGAFVIGAPSPAVTLSTEGPTRLEANPLYYRSSEQTQRFEREWEQARKRQDAQLERLERGVGTLGEMARGMQEELDKQAPIVDDIDQQLHKVTARLKSNNAKLKGLVLQVRSRRNFCLDIILICIVLGIIVYIVSLVQKQRQPQQAQQQPSG